MAKVKDDCPHCLCDTRPMKMRAWSNKFSSYFCSQSCYEYYSNTLDGNSSKNDAEAGIPGNDPVILETHV